MARARSDIGEQWQVSVSQGTRAIMMLAFGTAAEEIKHFLDLEEQNVIDLV